MLEQELTTHQRIDVLEARTKVIQIYKLKTDNTKNVQARLTLKKEIKRKEIREVENCGEENKNILKELTNGQLIIEKDM
jgi:hypothetical protein